MSTHAIPAEPHTADGRIGGRYRPERLLVRTANGTTWLAIDDAATKEDCRVVLKLIQRPSLASASGRDHGLSHLEHLVGRTAPGLPTLLATGRDGERSFAVFDWTGGEPLDEMISGDVRTLRWDLRNVLVAQLATAVDALHWSGLAHLALSPATILYHRGTRTLRLLDWGHMAPLAAPTVGVAAPGVTLATLPYASEGMLAGTSAEVTDDIYATGCIAYEVLAGAHPYDRRTARDAAALHLSAPREPSLDGRQLRALTRALAPAAPRRNVTLRELAAAFRPDGERDSGQSTLLWARRLQWISASWRTALASVATIAALAIGGATFGPAWLASPAVAEGTPDGTTLAVADPQAPLTIDDHPHTQVIDTSPVTTADAGQGLAGAMPLEITRIEEPTVPAVRSTTAGPKQPSRDAPRVTRARPAASSAAAASRPSAAAAADAPGPVGVPQDISPVFSATERGRTVSALRDAPTGPGSRFAAAGNDRTEDRPANTSPAGAGHVAVFALRRPAPAHMVVKPTCPQCECPALLHKRSFTPEPLRAEESDYLRRHCERG